MQSGEWGLTVADSSDYTRGMDKEETIEEFLRRLDARAEALDAEWIDGNDILDSVVAIIRAHRDGGVTDS